MEIRLLLTCYTCNNNITSSLWGNLEYLVSEPSLPLYFWPGCLPVFLPSRIRQWRWSALTIPLRNLLQYLKVPLWPKVLPNWPRRTWAGRQEPVFLSFFSFSNDLESGGLKIHSVEVTSLLGSWLNEHSLFCVLHGRGASSSPWVTCCVVKLMT